MHYGGNWEPCMAYPSEPYMTLKPSGQDIPINKNLSILDLEALNKFYAPPSK